MISSNNKGFVQILVVILIVIVALSLLGVNFKVWYQKITSSKTLTENFNFIKEKIVEYYYKIKVYIVDFFSESPKNP